MARMPKRVNIENTKRAMVRPLAARPSLGDFGPDTEGGWISAEVIEAVLLLSSILCAEGNFTSASSHKSVTSIPLETRMGKGRGTRLLAAVVRPGGHDEIAGVPKRQRSLLQPSVTNYP